MRLACSAHRILTRFVWPFTCCWCCGFSPYGSASVTNRTKDKTPPWERRSNEGSHEAMREPGTGRSKVVVVTGASAGVGRAIVREFAKHGDSLGLLARSRDGLAGARLDVERLGGRALEIPTDVSDDRAVDEAAERIEQELGPIDIWINNAMVSVLSPALQMNADEYRRVTDVTYLGYVYGTLAALRRMVPRNRGVVIQIGSALAYRSIPLQSAYCAAKAAIRGFTDSLRTELIHDGSKVKLTMLQLPAVNTPQSVR